MVIKNKFLFEQNIFFFQSQQHKVIANKSEILANLLED